MASIDNTQSLSIESFSYNWLMNLKPSLEGLEDSFRTSIDAYDEASFIEMDPKLPPSERFSTSSHAPSKQLFHADQLINHGYLMPLFVKPLKMERDDTSVNHKDQVRSSSRSRCAYSFRRCRRLSKQILEKYIDFLRPLCQKIRWERNGTTPGNGMKKAKANRLQHKVKNSWEYYSSSSANSPSRASSVASYSVDNWRRSCDSESSIHDAVLHCKRTIGYS